MRILFAILTALVFSFSANAQTYMVVQNIKLQGERAPTGLIPKMEIIGHVSSEGLDIYVPGFSVDEMKSKTMKSVICKAEMPDGIYLFYLTSTIIKPSGILLRSDNPQVVGAKFNEMIAEYITQEASILIQQNTPQKSYQSSNSRTIGKSITTSRGKPRLFKQRYKLPPLFSVIFNPYLLSFSSRLNLCISHFQERVLSLVEKMAVQKWQR